MPRHAIETRSIHRCLPRFVFPLLILGTVAQKSAAVDLVGYIPYYRMNPSYNNGTLPAQLAMLNEVRYFGLTAGSDGSIVPLAGSGALQGHENNIAIIKQKIDAMPVGQRPRLDITFGGAGEATNFATIAGNPALSATFAQNINTLLNNTGASSIDIDWESPNNSNTSQLNSYASLLQQIKQTVGATRRVYATIEPQIRLPLTVFNGDNAIDGISLMTYELAWWANDPADTNRGEHSLPQYVTDTVDDWTNPPGSTNRRPYVFSTWGLDANPQDLGVGLPFFGRVIGTSAHPQGGTAYTYSDLVAGGAPDSSGSYYTYAGQTVLCTKRPLRLLAERPGVSCTADLCRVLPRCILEAAERDRVPGRVNCRLCAWYISTCYRYPHHTWMDARL